MPEKKRNPFPIKNFRGIDTFVIDRLESRRIKSAEKILELGRTRQLRAALARETGIPECMIMELVKLSDLARLPGVKGIRARLYYDAGVDCVEKMAGWEPNALLDFMAMYVAQTGFDGIAPLPKEVSSTIANAKKLPKIVEW